MWRWLTETICPPSALTYCWPPTLISTTCIHMAVTWAGLWVPFYTWLHYLAPVSWRRPSLWRALTSLSLFSWTGHYVTPNIWQFEPNSRPFIFGNVHRWQHETRSQTFHSQPVTWRLIPNMHSDKRAHTQKQTQTDKHVLLIILHFNRLAEIPNI